MRHAPAPLLALGLLACGNPISNQQIYADELFLTALPTTDRLGPPSEVRTARVGTSALLASAVGEAASVNGLSLLIGASGEALRGATPDERSEALRRWNKVSTAVRIDPETTATWWVRGEVVQPVGSEGLDWTVEASADGLDWQVVGTGLHAPEGLGTLTWEVGAHVALLGLDDEVPETMTLDYRDATNKDLRELAIDDGSLELGGTWQVLGENLLIWFGNVTLIDGDDPRPGAAQVLHLPGVGGRGSGSLVTVEGEVPFDVCWDANGNDVYVEEDGTPALGFVGNCTVSFE